MGHRKETQLFELEGRNALVTGASGGIGAAIARTLHGAGAAVSLSGTRVESLEALAAELGGRAYVVPANLADAAAVAALPGAAEAAMGSIDILVEPYSQTTKGATRIVIFANVDVAVRHAESFTAAKDLVTT